MRKVKKITQTLLAVSLLLALPMCSSDDDDDDDGDDGGGSVNCQINVENTWTGSSAINSLTMASLENIYINGERANTATIAPGKTGSVTRSLPSGTSSADVCIEYQGNIGKTSGKLDCGTSIKVGNPSSTALHSTSIGGGNRCTDSTPRPSPLWCSSEVSLTADQGAISVSNLSGTAESYRLLQGGTDCLTATLIQDIGSLSASAYSGCFVFSSAITDYRFAINSVSSDSLLFCSATQSLVPDQKHRQLLSSKTNLQAYDL